MADAEALYRRALSIKESLLGRDHPDVALSLNNLALLLEGTDGRLKPGPCTSGRWRFLPRGSTHGTQYRVRDELRRSAAVSDARRRRRRSGRMFLPSARVASRIPDA